MSPENITDRNNPVETALAWLNLGFHPIPIEQTAMKKPAELGWQNARFTAEEIPQHILAHHNVGILLGDERGTADVDMDCFEAIAAGRRLLPDTGIRFGRDGKPASHAIYLLAPSINTKQYKDPHNKAMIVELRCHAKNGRCMQTVVPYSIHTKSKERLRFEPGTNGTPATLAADVLEAAVAMVAAAALLGRYYPKFERNSTELAIAGILARKGWDVETAVHFVNAVYACAPANDAGTSGGDMGSPTAETSVRSTFAAFEGKHEVTGFPRLRECYGANVKAVDIAFKWLNIVIEEEEKRPKSLVLDPGRSYKEYLIMTGGKDSHPKTDVANVAITLRYDESWKGAFGFDEFTSMVMLKRDELPHQRLRSGPVLEEHFGYIQEWFQMAANHHGVPLQTVMQACYMVAKENSSHPVLDYLADLDPWTSETDEARLDTWIIKYLGAEDKPVNRIIGRKWLISMIARVKNPGCQADHMPILEGEQGIRKSTAMRTLMPNNDWFTDRLPDINSKDADIQLQGKWLIEWAELDSLTRAETARVKAFITQQVSRFRPPYGKVAQDFKRQCIFVGTSNTFDYLKDETGGRRFWPVRLGFGLIDIDGLKRDRDLLWAEALARYNMGETWWPNDSGEQSLLTVEQEERYFEPAIASQVMAWADDPRPGPPGSGMDGVVLSTPGCVLIREVMSYVLQKNAGNMDRSTQMEVSKILIKNKWVQGRKTVNGRTERVYMKPEAKK